jgi:uncharacterized protein (TIGR03067 family)
MKTLATLCVALALVALAAADDKAKLDPGKLVGDWTYVSGVRGGEKVDKERLAGKVTVTKDTFTLPAGPQDKFVMTYRVDAKAVPAKIDLDIKSGPVNEGKAEGIIAVDGDEMKICYVVAGLGGKRPEKFESTKENGAFYFVLKRAR